MKFAKSFISILLSSVIFGISYLSVAAKPDINQITTITKEISSDLWEEVLPGANISILGETVQAHKVTAINSIQTRSGETVQMMRSDTIGVISLSDSITTDDLFETMTAASQEGHYASSPDPSLTATIWTQIYYNITTYSGSNIKYYSYARITGGFSGAGSGAGLDSGVVCNAQHIHFGQTGMTRNDGYVSYTGEDHFAGNQRSWTSSYNFSSWKPIANYPSMTALGCTLTTVFKRGSSTWNAELQNYALKS